MSTRSKEPGRGRRAPVPKWDYHPVPNGGSTVGWKAGPYCGVYVHLHGGSKPCRHITSDGRLSCPWCVAGEPATWRGYVPFYDQDYRRRFVLINEDYAEAFREIELHSPVKIQRGKGKRDPLVIRFENWRTLPLPVTPERRDAVDLFPALLRVWKDVELTKWHEASDMPPSLEPDTDPVEIVNRIARRTDEAAGKRDQRSGADILAAAGIDVGQGGESGTPGPKPSKNGKAHK